MAATTAFLLAFALSRVTVVPREEQLMESKYGAVYRRYMCAGEVAVAFAFCAWDGLQVLGLPVQLLRADTHSLTMCSSGVLFCHGNLRTSAPL